MFSNARGSLFFIFVLLSKDYDKGEKSLLYLWYNGGVAAGIAVGHVMHSIWSGYQDGSVIAASIFSTIKITVDEGRALKVMNRASYLYVHRSDRHHYCFMSYYTTLKYCSITYYIVGIIYNIKRA